jgi:predicted nucleic acid-binding protein
MTVVVDACALIALAVDEPARGLVEARIRDWTMSGQELAAPTLAHYEINSGLVKAVAAGFLVADIPAAIASVASLPISYHEAVPDSRVVEIAISLGRRSAYDAAYIALAERLGAELWTLDGPLYRNAASFGYPVRLFA